MKTKQLISGRRKTGSAFLLCILLVPTGCALVKDAVIPSRVKLTWTASEDVNGGRALQLRIYQLKSANKFNSVLSIELQNESDGKKILGSDLVGEPQMEFIQPAGKGEIAFEIQPSVEFIGVMADFRKSNDRSKVIQKISLNRKSHIAIDATKSAIAIREVSKGLLFN